MTLHALERPAEGEPQGTLVLLHGRGADEHDLFPLLDALDPERRLLGVTPRGPLVAPARRRALVPARRHPDARPGHVLGELRAAVGQARRSCRGRSSSAASRRGR